MQSPRLDFTAQGVLSLFAIAVLVGYAANTMRPLPETSMELNVSGAQTQSDSSAPVLSAATAYPMTDTTVARPATLRGTILRDRANFVLRDSAGMVYRLDDSAKAMAFEGKSVKVTGTLEESARLIHVQQIQDVNA